MENLTIIFGDFSDPPLSNEQQNETENQGGYRRHEQHYNVDLTDIFRTIQSARA